MPNEWNEAHREEYLAYQKRWREEHPDYWKEKYKNTDYWKQWRTTHQDVEQKKAKTYYQLHTDDVSKRNREIRKSKARQIWEEHFHVKIPAGFVIHHKDEDRTNNDPTNLLCLDNDEHIKLHWIKRGECKQ